MENKCQFTSIEEYVSDQKNSLKKVIKEAYYFNEVPCLAIVQVGDNKASNSYISGKIKDCLEVGVVPNHIKVPETITVEKFKTLISGLSKSDNVHGIIIQKPLPDNLEINFDTIVKCIDDKKDVDGFRKDSNFVPCTPLGILNYINDEIRHKLNFGIAGKHCVIVGRSDLVGKPMADLMLREDCTVTICHSKTRNLKEITRQADILIVAIGKPKTITGEYVKDSAIVIDVGINVGDDGKLCGDVDYNDVADKCLFCSPVPKGVGLLTRLALLNNFERALMLQDMKFDF